MEKENFEKSEEKMAISDLRSWDSGGRPECIVQLIDRTSRAQIRIKKMVSLTVL